MHVDKQIKKKSISYKIYMANQQHQSRYVDIIKQSLSASLKRINHLISLPKTFYQKYPKITISLGLTALLIGGGLSYLISKQQAALYFPSIGWGKQNCLNPVRMRHPNSRGLSSEDLQIVTEDGVILRGWYIKRENAQRVIVYFHGNAGNIGTRLPFAQELMNHTNSQVIMIGYRGYSDSQGVPTQKGLEKDSEAILKKAIEITQGTGKKLYVFGTSLGGAIAIYVSGLTDIRDKISGLIVENTFTSTTEVIPYHVPFMKVLVPMIGLVNRNSWDSLKRIGKVKRPIFFIKCGKDEIVPSTMTDRLRQECNKYHIHNYLYELPEGLHNEVHIMDPVRYFNQLNEFFKASQ